MEISILQSSMSECEFVVKRLANKKCLTNATTPVDHYKAGAVCFHTFSDDT